METKSLAAMAAQCLKEALETVQQSELPADLRGLYKLKKQELAEFIDKLLPSLRLLVECIPEAPEVPQPVLELLASFETTLDAADKEHREMLPHTLYLGNYNVHDARNIARWLLGIVRNDEELISVAAAHLELAKNRHGMLLDADGNPLTYALRVYCANCLQQSDVTLARGTEFATRTVCCPKCGCYKLRRKGPPTNFEDIDDVDDDGVPVTPTTPPATPAPTAPSEPIIPVVEPWPPFPYPPAIDGPNPFPYPYREPVPYRWQPSVLPPFPNPIPQNPNTDFHVTWGPRNYDPYTHFPDTLGAGYRPVNQQYVQGLTRPSSSSGEYPG